MFDIDTFIVAKSLEYGISEKEDITLSQFIHQIGSNRKYNSDDLSHNILAEHIFIPELRDIAFNIHPCYVNLLSHSHDFIEINYMYCGNCKQILNKCQKIELHKGDILIIKKGTSHSIELNKGKDDIIINCLLSDQYFTRKQILQTDSYLFLREVLKSSTEKMNNSDYLYISSSSINDVHLYFENSIKEFYNPKICSENIIDSYVNLIFAEICRSQYSGLDNIIDNRNCLILKIVEYIRKHYSYITLKNTADFFHLSPNYLSLLIKKQFNKTFINVVQEIRLNQAYKEIINTDQTIEVISKNVGYENTYYFTKIFSAHYGCLPSSIRKS